MAVAVPAAAVHPPFCLGLMLLLPFSLLPSLLGDNTNRHEGAPRAKTGAPRAKTYSDAVRGTHRASQRGSHLSHQ